MLSGSLDGSIRLWCRSQHQALVTVSPHNAPVTAIVIDTPLDVKVKCEDVRSREFISLFLYQSGLVRQHVFTASRDGTVRRMGLVAAWDRAGAGIQLIRLD